MSFHAVTNIYYQHVWCDDIIVLPADYILLKVALITQYYDS
jgi:hypothetical protein